MNKPLVIIIIAIVAIAAFFGVRSHQKSAFQKKFKEEFQSIPQDMSAELKAMQNEFLKLDILTAYPEAIFYLDFKILKDRTLPPSVLKDMEGRKGWMCPAFYEAMSADFKNANGFERSVFLEQIKEDQVVVEFKFRNAFSETVYSERQILAECPEYLKAVYNN